MDQDVSILEDRFHPLGVGDEVRRQIAAVKLHAFDHFQLRLQRLRLFNGDDAVLADLLHRLSNDLSDRRIIVRADCPNLANHLAGDGLGEPVQFAFAAVAGFRIDCATNE